MRGKTAVFDGLKTASISFKINIRIEHMFYPNWAVQGTNALTHTTLMRFARRQDCPKFTLNPEKEACGP
jgi:hypothetical protein